MLGCHVNVRSTENTAAVNSAELASDEHIQQLQGEQRLGARM
jgi:hypothetical protein